MDTKNTYGIKGSGVSLLHHSYIRTRKYSNSKKLQYVYGNDFGQKRLNTLPKTPQGANIKRIPQINTIPPIKDERVKYVPIGCQECIECRKQKARQ